MPELPEVETIVRGLRPRVEGERIAAAEFLWPRTCTGSVDDTESGLVGQRIESLTRWGKYLVFGLAKGKQRSVLVVHLRMTGSFLVDAEVGPWTRAVLRFRGGKSLVFNDIRKFGRFEWSQELPPRLLELGPEPLEIDADDFYKRLKKRSARVKAVLLNQEFLRGLGNIYCDEALFRSGIHPSTNTARIGRKRSDRLHAEIQATLREAIAQGGSSVVNYVDSNGMQGYFQLHTYVYGKTGEDCKRCGSKIRRTLISQRSTHYCPRCQRR